MLEKFFIDVKDVNVRGVYVVESLEQRMDEFF